MSTITAIIAAAGMGTRFSQDKKILKQFIKINEKRILDYSIDIFSKFCEEIIVVLPKNFTLSDSRVAVVEGGATRRDSVYNGLLAAAGGVVLIHDAARPFVTEKVIENVISAVKKYGAAIPVVPAKETIKIIENNFITKTITRSSAFLAQTPQGFNRELILDCFNKTLHIQNFTDDASVAEACGVRVYCAAGDVDNIKITYQRDLG